MRARRSTPALVGTPGSRRAASRAFLNRRMQDSSLSLAQFGLMAQIASARDDTLSELAQRTGLDQSTLSRNLQVLEAAGLVEIAAGDRDARRRAVWLTEKGAQSLEAGLADWKRAHGELAKRLDPEMAKLPGSGGRGAGGGIGERVTRKRLQPLSYPLMRLRGGPFSPCDSRRNRDRRSRAASWPRSRAREPCARERESRVEGRSRGAADDVRADAQPVGIEAFIAGPALQVRQRKVRFRQ